MKVLIIGAVAAGTKTAAKLKRCDRSAEVTILTRSADISYAGCGLPYYVGGLIENRGELIVNTPQSFEKLTGVKVWTRREAVSVDTDRKQVKAVNLENGEEEIHSYDSLVLAVGASSVVPPVEGVSVTGVFTLRTPDDAVQMKEFIQETPVKRAVVVGGSFIGLEMAENLHARGISVTVIDSAPQILPNVLDADMADYASAEAGNPCPDRCESRCG